MKKNLLFIAVLTIVSSITINAQEHGLIVKIKPNYAKSLKLNSGKYISGNKNLEQVIGKQVSGAYQLGDFTKTGTLFLPLTKDQDVSTVLAGLKGLNEVVYAEPNFEASGSGIKEEALKTTTPNDTYFSRQWSLSNNGTMTGIGPVKANADVDMDLAWDLETGDPNLTVAVIDSGFKMDHPELAGRIWTNPLEIPGNGIDDDNNGLIDDVKGWDYVNNDNDPTDDHGHGTNCAGIILAKGNNNIGYAGANWNSKLMVLKVLNANNSGSYASMINSIYYAVDNGAKVISMSIGGTSFSQGLKDAVDYAYNHNVAFIVCMMNENNEVTYYPAGYDNVIAVGSTSANDYRTNPFFWSSTSGSNYGNHIDVVAPGNYIYGLSHTSNTNYNSYWGGTSQATPLVAGIVSLMFSKKSDLTIQEIRTILFNTSADMVGNPTEDTLGWDKYMGWGRVNAYQALKSPTLASVDVSTAESLSIVNPVKDQIVVQANNISGLHDVKIYSVDGKLIYQKNINLNKGHNTIPSNFGSGIYFMNIESPTYKKTFKITKL